MTVLSTIGYEGASLQDFLSTLQAAGVRRVIDVRDVPASRRPGFSKNVLASALAIDGIEYVHLKPLGDPKPGRDAARQGRFEEFIEIFETHLALPAGQQALRVAADLAIERPSVLLCYERTPTQCHRTIVASAMAELRPELKIRVLGVNKLKDNRREQRIGNADRSVAIATC